MGGESVGFQIVSDQGECLRSAVTGRANYEDEFYSVRCWLLMAAFSCMFVCAHLVLMFTRCVYVTINKC